MKKIIPSTILLTLLAFSGCDWFEPEDFPPDPDIEHYTTIYNNSAHNIFFERYYKGDIFTFIISKNKELVISNQIYIENLPFFISWGDSIRVTYDNDVVVWHKKDLEQDVSRSIMLESSYTGGKVNDKLYEIYYTFTDEDYEEAVALNEGG